MQKIEILDIGIDNLTLVAAKQQLLSLMHNRSGRYHCAFVNADCLNIASEDPAYKATLEQCELIFGDGSGVRYAARLLGTPIADNVNGTDLFPLICAAAAEQGQSIYFLGGKPGVAKAAAARAVQRFPGLEIAGCQHGFHEDWQPVIDDINHSGAAVLLVAMGAPVQEKWIAQHRQELTVPVAIGVGGLLDFVARQVSRAPRWVRVLGFEWIVRLLNEPRRLMQRYLVGNPLFLYRVWRWRRLNSRQTLPLVPVTPSSQDFRSLGSRFDVWQDFEILDKVEAKYGALAAGPNVIRSALKNTTSRIRRWVMNSRFHAVKRLMDIFVSGAALLCLAPLFLLTALAIVVENPGPVFYSQIRVGRFGCLFPMYKFRSMIKNADSMKTQLADQNESTAGVIFKMKEDPRITRVGRFIRRLSIDELPQLINVLKGDMTLVGPRPPVPAEVAEYSLEERQRLDVTPGITCIWQVSGRSDIDFTGQVELDLHYINSRSIRSDVGLLFKTVPAVLSGKGAY